VREDDEGEFVAQTLLKVKEVEEDGDFLAQTVRKMRTRSRETA
jgi:hypothetical protein